MKAFLDYDYVGTRTICLAILAVTGGSLTALTAFGEKILGTTLRAPKTASQLQKAVQCFDLVFVLTGAALFANQGAVFSLFLGTRPGVGAATILVWFATPLYWGAAVSYGKGLLWLWGTAISKRNYAPAKHTRNRALLHAGHYAHSADRGGVTPK